MYSESRSSPKGRVMEGGGCWRATRGNEGSVPAAQAAMRLLLTHSAALAKTSQWGLAAVPAANNNETGHWF
jgi:hypothetical protein